MTLKIHTCPDGTTRTQWVACPYCEGPMRPQESFRRHWRTCPENPQTADRETMEAKQ